MPEQETEERDGIWIDGDLYTEDDLTYGEQREVRKLIKQANSDDEQFDVGDTAIVDLVPAIVTVVKRREDPDFSWNQALEMKPSDLRKPDTDPPTEEG